jgi:hypothetical protein
VCTIVHAYRLCSITTSTRTLSPFQPFSLSAFPLSIFPSTTPPDRRVSTAGQASRASTSASSVQTRQGRRVQLLGCLWRTHIPLLCLPHTHRSPSPTARHPSPHPPLHPIVRSSLPFSSYLEIPGSLLAISYKPQRSSCKPIPHLFYIPATLPASPHHP